MVIGTGAVLADVIADGMVGESLVYGRHSTVRLSVLSLS